MIKFAGIIPARFASTRFPGKPLVMIKGKTMIQRVYLQASKVLEHVCVATDDVRIKEEVLGFGGKVIMTSPEHQSGTDRCAEAIEVLQKQMKEEFDVVLNIQGDEPFIQPVQLEKLMSCFNNSETQIATLVKPIHSNPDIFNPNHVKVVIDNNFRALYFSRSPIPYIRNKDNSDWSEHHSYYKHLGIYAYKTDVLKEITKLSQSPLELAESLEQLRWLENGYRIIVETTDLESISVDTPEDLNKLNLINFTD
jgi:3-deoxy-manno-octulosonate cytidylyltransferase (CMP-KDO synthetase)